MSKLCYDFKWEVMSEGAFVRAPQIVVIYTEADLVQVEVYVMDNTAIDQINGLARAAMGHIKLQYQATSSSAAYCASVKLIKMTFVFHHLTGMNHHFVFAGAQ